jgi:hypothetical protein
MTPAKHVLSDAEGHASKNSKPEIRNSKQSQMTKIESTKSEARSSKQIQNDEKQNHYNAPNGTDRIHCFGFSDFEFILAPICFGFRYSDFGFVSLVAWREKLS